MYLLSYCMLYAETISEGNGLILVVEEPQGFPVSARIKMKKVLNPDGTLRSEGL